MIKKRYRNFESEIDSIDGVVSHGIVQLPDDQSVVEVEYTNSEALRSVELFSDQL